MKLLFLLESAVSLVNVFQGKTTDHTVTERNRYPLAQAVEPGRDLPERPGVSPRAVWAIIVCGLLVEVIV